MPYHWEEEIDPSFYDEEPLWRTAGLHRAPPDFSYEEDPGIRARMDADGRGGPETPDSTTVYGIKAPPGIEGYIDRYREAYEPRDFSQAPEHYGDQPFFTPVSAGPAYYPTDLQVQGGPVPGNYPTEEGYTPPFPYGEYPMTEMPLEGVENLPGGIAAHVLGTTYDLTPSQKDVNKRRMGAKAYLASQTKEAKRRERHAKETEELHERYRALKQEMERYPLTPLGWQKAYSGTEIEEYPTRANPNLRTRKDMRRLIENRRRKRYSLMRGYE